METEVRVAERYLHEAGDQWDFLICVESMVWPGCAIDLPGQGTTTFDLRTDHSRCLLCTNQSSAKAQQEGANAAFHAVEKGNGTNWTRPKFLTWPIDLAFEVHARALFSHRTGDIPAGQCILFGTPLNKQPYGLFWYSWALKASKHFFS